MKIGHVVLFAAAASALTYLSSVIKDEGDDSDEILRELEELTDTQSQKLIDEKEEAEDLDSSIEDDIQDITESLKFIGESIIDDIFNEPDDAIRIDKEEDEDIDEALKEVFAELEIPDDQKAVNEEEHHDEDEIIKEIEDLLASINTEKEDDDLSFDEDGYLKEIQKAIDETIALDENGQEVDMSEVFKDEKADNDEIDKIFSEILRQEDLSDEKVEEKENAEDAYLDELAEELKDALEVDEVEEDKDIYSKISELYPYLSLNFIRAVYDLKESLANEYPYDRYVLLLHRISFVTIDELRQFTEIVLDHDYQINVDEGKMIVDVIKEFINEDGKILANIFEIANQARLLNGEYEGYRVDIVD